MWAVYSMIMHVIKVPLKFDGNRQDNTLRIHKTAISATNKCHCYPNYLTNSHFSEWIMMSSDKTQIKISIYDYTQVLIIVASVKISDLGLLL